MPFGTATSWQIQAIGTMGSPGTIAGGACKPEGSLGEAMQKSRSQ